MKPRDRARSEAFTGASTVTGLTVVAGWDEASAPGACATTADTGRTTASAGDWPIIFSRNGSSAMASWTVRTFSPPEVVKVISWSVTWCPATLVQRMAVEVAAPTRGAKRERFSHMA